MAIGQQMEEIRHHIYEHFDADAYLDFSIETMEREIDAGWRSYYAMQTWLKAHAQAPWINDVGRRYAKVDLLKRYSPSRADIDWLIACEAENSPFREGYRSYLDVRCEERHHLGTDRFVDFWDKEASRVINTMVREQGRLWPEILRDWSSTFDWNEAMRAQALYAELDIERYIVDDSSRNHCSRDMLLCLASEVLKGWTFTEQRSKKRSLVFTRPFTEDYAWAIELGSADGANLIQQCIFGLTSIKSKRALDANTFVNLSRGSGSETHWVATAIERLKMNKLFIRDAEGAVAGTIWRTGADLLFKAEHISHCIRFFTPLLQPVCK